MSKVNQSLTDERSIQIAANCFIIRVQVTKEIITVRLVLTATMCFATAEGLKYMHNHMKIKSKDQKNREKNEISKRILTGKQTNTNS